VLFGNEIIGIAEIISQAMPKKNPLLQMIEGVEGLSHNNLEPLLSNNFKLLMPDVTVEGTECV
jgi:hypothetical protein